MSRTKNLTDLAGLFMLCCSLVYLWRPATYLLFIAGNAIFVAAMVFAAIRATPADRDRGRRNAWLIPASTLLIAAFVVGVSPVEERPRTAVLAGGLVAAGLVLFWARRRAA